MIKRRHFAFLMIQEYGLGSFILILFAYLLNRFYFFIAKLVSASHIYHPDIVCPLWLIKVLY